ncbi:hypothetical protein RJT34_15974 [Clitoria ternatea]|uniref:F-box domain-containing protein n=1 Tax=Clitoria ternatea TaxID=43366 RepID=A0AAN9J8D4_CLITE
MGDRISHLPDAILCHILSFLTTKTAVQTSILSRRWNPLWRSVPTLDFDDSFYAYNFNTNKETYSRFVHSVHHFLRSRDSDHPIHTFRLRCWSSHCDATDVSDWVSNATRRRVEHLDLHLPHPIHMPPTVLTCKTLTVLKLIHLSVIAFPFVDFPSLKIMHLDGVDFVEHCHFAELLSASPNLEDLKARNLYFNSYEIEGKFKRLHKLVRADVVKLDVPLEVVGNVEFLRINWMDEEEEMVESQGTSPDCKDPIPEFNNLTHIEFGYWEYTKDWAEVLKVMKHCPKLQILTIDKRNIEFFPEGDAGADWLYPQSVPTCISLHIKSCCLKNYKGSKGEFRFARYIMRNARLLRTMTIYSNVYANRREKLKMIKKLSSCTRRSATCKLSFK